MAEVSDLRIKNEAYFEVLRELINMPFYKVDNGYKFGGRMLHDPEKSPNLVGFFEEINSEKGTEPAEDIESINNTVFQDAELNQQFLKLIDDLLDLFISDECFDLWNTAHKEGDEISLYHNKVREIKELLLTAAITDTVTDLDIHPFNSETDIDYDSYKYSNGNYRVAKSRAVNVIMAPFSDSSKANTTISSQKVLNHRNPFADISIKEQSFIYGSSYGQFETLRMVTSHILTKVENDTETSFIAMNPGFKIQKEHDCIAREIPSVMFDDTISSKMADDESELYVYID